MNSHSPRSRRHPLGWKYRLGQAINAIDEHDDDIQSREVTTVVGPGVEEISPGLSNTYLQEKQTAGIGITREDLTKEPEEPSPLFGEEGSIDEQLT